METQSKKQNEYEAHLEAYKLLVSMLQHEEVLFWRRNEIFLLINGGLLTILGLHDPLQTGVLSAFRFAVPVCITGFIMCILWFIIVSRSEAFYNLWHEQLEYLERAHLAPIKIFTIANEYFVDHQTVLGDKVLKFTFPARTMRIFRALSLVMVLFMIVWLVILIGLIIFP